MIYYSRSVSKMCKDIIIPIESVLNYYSTQVNLFLAIIRYVLLYFDTLFNICHQISCLITMTVNLLIQSTSIVTLKMRFVYVMN